MTLSSPYSKQHLHDRHFPSHAEQITTRRACISTANVHLCIRWSTSARRRSTPTLLLSRRSRASPRNAASDPHPSRFRYSSARWLCLPRASCRSFPDEFTVNGASEHDLRSNERMRGVHADGVDRDALEVAVDVEAAAVAERRVERDAREAILGEK